MTDQAHGVHATTVRFNDAGEDISGGHGPERVLLMNGQWGHYLGSGLGLYIQPETRTLDIAAAVTHGAEDAHPPQLVVYPSDYETYFATMVIRTVVPVLRELWEEDLPLTDDEMAEFYRPVYEDHQLPNPPDGGL